jgi:2-C-methyl-D-erythritol 2,4-cyclodiphosphate synthase
MRIGFGYDVHPLAQGRRLVLGGVELAYERGLAGHSDADVLVHAIIDALLGAAALGDIGVHFPPSDPAYKDISSILLLRHVAGVLRDEGWRVGNIDATVVAQRPQLAPFISDMRQRISEALGIDKGKVSVKATTSEGLGFAGREEGIAAYAVAALEGGNEDA